MCRILAGRHAYDLNQPLKKWRVYKTHGLPDALPAGSMARVLFLFGRVSDSVLSVIQCRERYGRNWMEEHFRHMQACGSYEELAKRDVLRYREQIESWTNAANVQVLALKYETLWRNVAVVSNFVGYHVEMPLWRPRAPANLSDELVCQVRQTYAEHDALVDSLPDCRIYGAQHRTEPRAGMQFEEPVSGHLMRRNRSGAF
jgi:hypothetical protein